MPYPQGPNRLPSSAEDRLLERLRSLEARLGGVERRGASATWSGSEVALHGGTHFTGGSDAIAPGDIGAATALDLSDLEGDLERQTTTQTITVAAGAEASVNLSLHTAFNIWKIETNKAARIRIYTSTAERTADTSRAVGVAPAAGAGLITEVITTSGLLEVPMCPAQIGASLETTPSSSIPALIKNNGTSSNVTLTITWSRAER